MFTSALTCIDWFVPDSARRNKSEFGRARNFVFTHIAGPVMSSPILWFLYKADPEPVIPTAVIAACFGLFLALPFILRSQGHLPFVAILSVECLTFVTLFGSFYYGGVSSPFLPWLLVALLLGFFYIDRHPLVVIAIVGANIVIFSFVLFIDRGSSNRITTDDLALVGLLSVVSATIYMIWMGIYYGNLLSTEAQSEMEVLHHRKIAVRLAATKALAEQADRDTSIFLAKMSHELRTPLNAVIGYSELLLEDAEGAQAHERASDLSKINAAGKHLLALVTDVLDISAVEAVNDHVNVSEFDLTRLLNDVLSTIQPVATKNENRLESAFDTRLGRIASDPVILQQILLNLLSNAAKFTRGGTISLKCWRVGTMLTDWIDFEVKDTGPGMGETDIAKLFGKFSQTTSSRSSKQAGTGLGLALSQRFAGMLGGAITVESKLGVGSTFRLRLPANVDPQAAESITELAE